MKDNILLVLACKEESCGLFESFNNVLFTGVGKINATYNLTKRLYELKKDGIKIDLVLNFGSAGSPKFKKGNLVYCRKFIQYDMDAREFGYDLGITPSDSKELILEHKKIVSNLQEAICATADRFSSVNDFKDIADLADMEGYALAKVCKMENIDFCSIKYISDDCTAEDILNWEEECKNGAKLMFDYLNKNF